MSDTDHGDWEPMRLGTDQYFDPVSGRYTYRVKGKFAPMPDFDLPPSIQDELDEAERLEALREQDEEYAQYQPNISDWIPITDSSRCLAARYDYDARKLLVAWTNGKRAWAYNGVSEQMFNDFMSAESAGKYVNYALNSIGDRGSVSDQDVLTYFRDQGSQYVGV